MCTATAAKLVFDSSCVRGSHGVRIEPHLYPYIASEQSAHCSYPFSKVAIAYDITFCALHQVISPLAG